MEASQCTAPRSAADSAVQIPVRADSQTENIPPPEVKTASSAEKVETRSQKQFRMRKINNFFPKLSKKDNLEKSQKRPLQETEDEPYLSHSESSESDSSSGEECILPAKKKEG